MRTLIVLAGGSSSRMDGVFKPLLRVCGRSLLEHVVWNLSDISQEVIVSVKDRDQEHAIKRLVSLPLSTRFVVDVLRIRSPLAGMYSALLSARGRIAIIAPSDTPFLTANVYRVLLSRLPGHDAAVPDWGDGRIEPLVGVCYKAPVLHAIIDAIGDGKLKIREIYRRVKTAFVNVHDLTDNPELTFMNINNDRDLEIARRICGEV